MAEHISEIALASVTAAATAAASAGATREEILKIGFQLQDICRRLADLENDLKLMKLDIASINAAANKWKGGFLVLVALGGIIAWLSSIGGNVMRVIK